MFLLHRGVVIEHVTAFDVGGGIQWSRMGERTNGTACQSQVLLPHKQQPWETLKGQHTAPKVGGPSQTFLSTHELHPHIRRPWSPPSFPLTGTGASWGREQAPTGPKEVGIEFGGAEHCCKLCPLSNAVWNLHPCIRARGETWGPPPSLGLRR